MFLLHMGRQSWFEFSPVSSLRLVLLVPVLSVLRHPLNKQHSENSNLSLTPSVT